MATAMDRPAGEAGAAIPSFSYAEAAKRKSTTSSTAQSSYAPSGPGTPLGETPFTSASITDLLSPRNWADDANTAHEDSPDNNALGPIVNAGTHGDESQLDTKDNPKRESQQRGIQAMQTGASAASTPTSPEFGTSSISTLPKEDDISSIPNASSESTWEEKSQASNPTDKTVEQKELGQKDALEKESSKEVTYVKTFQEAPIPTVNVWQQRAQEAKKRAASGHPTVRTTGTAQIPRKKDSANMDEVSQRGSKDMVGSNHSANLQLSLNKRPFEANSKTKESFKADHTRRGSRYSSNGDGDSSINNKRLPLRSRAFEHDDLNDSTQPQPSPPSVRDNTVWPTPESAQDEERRRAQTTVKGDKEKPALSGNPSHGKKGWKTMEYTPNVIFNTPLPNTHSRRGGRGGSSARVSREAGSRAGFSSIAENSSQPPNGTIGTTFEGQDRSPPHRGRSEPSDTNQASTSRRRASLGSHDSEISRAQEASNNKMDDPTGFPTNSNSNLPIRHEEPVIANNHVNSFPRPARQKAPGRKLENGNFERRREGEQMSASVADINAHPRGNGRRASVVNQHDDGGRDRRSSSARDGPPFFKGIRGDGLGRGTPEFVEGGSFSGPRGRSGRGGKGGYSNVSQSNVQFSNGHGTFQASSGYNYGRASSFPQGALTSASQQTRSYRSGGRTQPLAHDNFGRHGAGYAGVSAALTPIQPFMPAIYDYAIAQPMSAVPYGQSFVDPYQLYSLVATQIDYYFSVDNLCKDMFLRKHMDSKGFVYLSFIGNFNRVKQLTHEQEVLKYACYQSKEVEVRVGQDGRERLRRREGWEQWVLAKEERDPSAQHDDPGHLDLPALAEAQNGHGYLDGQPSSDTFGSPVSPGSAFFEPSYSSLMGMTVTGPGPLPSGMDSTNGPSPSSDTRQGGGARPLNSQIGPELGSGFPGMDIGDADSFSDGQIEALTVVVRKQENKPAASNGVASGTFSNGSLGADGGDDNPSEPAEGQASVAGSPAFLEDRGRSATRSPDGSRSQTRSLFWVKNNDKPVESLPPDSSPELYSQLHQKAVREREDAPPGSCPHDLDVLYQFWSHFLIRNFNTTMYNEFRRFAFNDAAQRSSATGMNNLIKYYGEALNSHYPIRERVARHYVQLVQNEDSSRDRPAFKQLRGALRNGALNFRNRKVITAFLQPELRAQLEE